MTSAVSIDQLAQRLDAYQEQLTALSQALGGLREISDNLIIALQADRAAFAAYEPMAWSNAAQTEATAPNTDGLETADAALVETQFADEPVALDEAPLPEATEIVEAPAAEAEQEEVAGETFDQVLKAEEAPVAEAITGEAHPADEAANQIAETLANVAQIAAANAPITTEADATTDPVADVIAEPVANIEAVSDGTVEQTAAEDATVKPSAAEAEAETQAAPLMSEQAAPALETAGAAEAADPAPSNVVDLASKRRTGVLGTPMRRRVATAAAMLVITAGATFGFNELMHSELGQRLIELSTCDADMLSANRDCAFLSWLTL